MYVDERTCECRYMTCVNNLLRAATVSPLFIKIPTCIGNRKFPWHEGCKKYAIYKLQKLIEIAFSVGILLRFHVGIQIYA